MPQRELYLRLVAAVYPEVPVAVGDRLDDLRIEYAILLDQNLLCVTAYRTTASAASRALRYPTEYARPRLVVS
jgi:hypothetical protein